MDEWVWEVGRLLRLGTVVWWDCDLWMGMDGDGAGVCTFSYCEGAMGDEDDGSITVRDRG